jgi:L-fucose isomerase-like protein
MKISLISLVSDVHDPGSVNRASADLLAQLKQWFDIEEITEKQIPAVEFLIILIKTGGTEHKFKALMPLLKECNNPITLLATGSNNSLPAAMEILSWLRQTGTRNNLLLHGSVKTLKKQIRQRAKDLTILSQLQQSCVGVVGQPSDWLIASGVDYNEVLQKWGIKLTDIPLQEVLESTQEITDKEASLVLPSFPSANFRKEIEDRDLIKAAKFYLGVKKVINHHHLSTLTLRCFDLLKPLETTGCLALARLNDEGIVAGCEGDIPALITMMVNRFITGKPSFMANPSQVDVEKKRLTVAHCTVPMTMVPSFGFRTHFESGIGVGIAGTFPEETPMTITKIGDQHMDRYYVAEGNLSAHKASEELCRTQMTILLNTGIDYFLNNPLGNHHIFSTGRHAQRFKEIMKLVGAVEVTD